MAILRKGFNFDFAQMAKQLGILNDPIISFTRASTATRINPASGLVESVAVNTPRMCGLQSLVNASDGSTKTIQPGLLVEGVATNYVPYSNFQAGYGRDFSPQPASTFNYTTAPDGTNTAMRLVTTSTPSDFYQMVASQLSGACVMSIWMRVPSGTMTLPNWGFGTNTGVQVKHTVTVDSVWRRYYITGTLAGGQAWTAIDLGDLPVGELWVWGAQFEQGTFPSSLIPTSGGSASRGGEIATIDISKIWNANAGTLICEADFGSWLSPSSYRSAYDVNDGTVYNREYYSQLPTGAVITAQLNFGVRTGRLRTAYAISGKASINGEAPITAGAVSANLTLLYVGNSLANTEQLNGTLQQLTYVPYILDYYTLKASSVLA